MTASLEAEVGAHQFDPEQFRISGVRALRGPNYWRLAPVIACDVRLGDLASVQTNELPGFNQRLVRLMEVIARGKRMVREGSLAVRDRFLEESYRNVSLVGEKFDPGIFDG